MILRPRAVNSTRFTWIPESRMYVAEQSDIGPFGQVYDDAIDEGLTLVNRFGTKEIVFCVDHTEVKEGDILYWDLKAVKPRNGISFKVRVYND